MPDRPILFSVAHSSKSTGADASNELLTEYKVSSRASAAAFRSLAGDFPVALYDVGPFAPSYYDDFKVAHVNGTRARLAIEIHCNSGPPGYDYSEVIYHRDGVVGAQAAAVIARTLAEGFERGRHGLWRSRGARANTIEQDRDLFFFLEKTKVPAIIVEGLFISNPQQASFLAAEGGAEAYGLLVAEGVRRWLGGER